MAVTTSSSSNIQGNTSLLQQIIQKLGLQWGRYCDVYPRKMINYFMSLPEYDILGICQQGAHTVSNIMFGGRGFRIKVKSGTPQTAPASTAQPNTPNMNLMGADRINQLIEDDVFGKCALRENLRRHFTSFLHLGNMSTSVGMGADGIDIRFHDGLSAIPLVTDATSVTKIANIYYKYMDDEDRVYALVTIDGQYVRMLEVLEVTGGNVGARVEFGTPAWYKAVGGDVQQITPMPQAELGHMKSQWWRLPTEDSRHVNTPFTSGLMWSYKMYGQILNAYLLICKEYGFKAPMIFYNKALDGANLLTNKFLRPLDESGINNTNLYKSQPGGNQGLFTVMFGKGDLGGPNAMGYWPNTDGFADILGIVGAIDKNYSIKEAIKNGSGDTIQNTLLPKDQPFEIFDQPIRGDYHNYLKFLLGRLGKTQFLGSNFYQSMTGEENAAQTLMNDRDLLNFITQIEVDSERPLKQLILACCDYWVEMGQINPLDVPSRMSEIEVIWDNSMIIDENAKNVQVLSSVGSIVSRQYALRNVFKLTEEEILKNDMELMADPIMMAQMTAEKNMDNHMSEAMFGKLGSSIQKPVGPTAKSSKPAQTNTSSPSKQPAPKGDSV